MIDVSCPLLNTKQLFECLMTPTEHVTWSCHVFAIVKLFVMVKLNNNNFSPWGMVTYTCTCTCRCSLYSTNTEHNGSYRSLTCSDMIVPVSSLTACVSPISATINHQACILLHTCTWTMHTMHLCAQRLYTKYIRHKHIPISFEKMVTLWKSVLFTLVQYKIHNSHKQFNL